MLVNSELQSLGCAANLFIYDIALWKGRHGILVDTDKIHLGKIIIRRSAVLVIICYSFN